MLIANTYLIHFFRKNLLRNRIGMFSARYTTRIIIEQNHNQVTSVGKVIVII